MKVIFDSVREHLEERAKEHTENKQEQRNFMLGSCEMLLSCVLYDISKSDKALFDQWMKYLTGDQKY